MPLGYLLDENQRGGLWQMAQRHNARGIDLLDVVRVGDFEELALGVEDATILAWAEQAGRILITNDVSTMPAVLSAHLACGRHSPGVFLLPAGRLASAVLEFLILAAYASDPDEWRDAARFIP